MIKFVNAKINIGLYITGKREDGYHNLETVFFPVGLESGTPHQPEAFDDILEVVSNPEGMSGCRFQFMGRKIDCEANKNIVVKAARKFLFNYAEKIGPLEKFGIFEITLDKHLPFGAGLGGGSADGAFTLETLNELTGEPFSKEELDRMALELGADCPFFLYNKPCFAEGVGEKLTPIELDLSGYQLLIVKPDVEVSTKDAFSGVSVGPANFDLRFLPHLPVEKWKDNIYNEFEKSVFYKYPVLGLIKESLYSKGAIYASMSGSGAALYAIFGTREKALEAREGFKSNYSDVWLFGL